MTRWTFTSESVTEGHPDKMADQISDSILDAMLTHDPMSRVACETMVTTGLAIVAGEITTEAYVDIPGTVRRTICDIGYDREAFGYDGNTCGVMIAIDEQSPTVVTPWYGKTDVGDSTSSSVSMTITGSIQRSRGSPSRSRNRWINLAARPRTFGDVLSSIS